MLTSTGNGFPKSKGTFSTRLTDNALVSWVGGVSVSVLVGIRTFNIVGVSVIEGKIVGTSGFFETGAINWGWHPIRRRTVVRIRIRVKGLNNNILYLDIFKCKS
jgi:hypothetical protein